MRTVIVTGGAGFIGVNFVQHLLAAEPATRVIVLDKLGYAGNPRSIAELAARGGARFRFVRGDVGDRELVSPLLAETRPSAIVHLAAESHVDRSIAGPAAFVASNVVGTLHLIDEVRAHLAHGGDPDFRFVHVSTDEVFGELAPTAPPFDEDSPYAPRSPYAASKAAADHLVAAYVHTYGLPAITTYCTNNYGPYQFPEKLVPQSLANALAGQRIPIYAAGDQVRDWIHVADHCTALHAILVRGRPGARYVVGARTERTNLAIVHALCDLLDELAPADHPHRTLIEHVADRPGHDRRYAIDPTRLETELGWRPAMPFATGLRQTVAWYLANRAWTDAVDLAPTCTP